MGKWMGDETPHATIFNISFGYLVPTKQREDAIKKEKKNLVWVLHPPLFQNLNPKFLTLFIMVHFF